VHALFASCLLNQPERNDLRRQKQAGPIQFLHRATGNCRTTPEHKARVIARPVFRLERRRKFESDDDSFDTADRGEKGVLKTNGIIHRGLGIPVALSQHRMHGTAGTPT